MKLKLSQTAGGVSWRGEMKHVSQHFGQLLNRVYPNPSDI